MRCKTVSRNSTLWHWTSPEGGESGAGSLQDVAMISSGFGVFTLEHQSVLFPTAPFPPPAWIHPADPRLWCSGRLHKSILRCYSMIIIAEFSHNTLFKTSTDHIPLRPKPTSLRNNRKHLSCFPVKGNIVARAAERSSEGTRVVFLIVGRHYFCSVVVMINSHWTFN